MTSTRARSPTCESLLPAKASVRFSGRTSTATESPLAEPASSGTRWPKTTASSPLDAPGRRLVSPMNVATYSVAGRWYRFCGAAICSILPLFITPMRSATASASS